MGPAVKTGAGTVQAGTGKGACVIDETLPVCVFVYLFVFPSVLVPIGSLSLGLV